LERGLAILECFTSECPQLGIADIADPLGMSRSTTHRYVITLVELGYLEQCADRKYRLGIHPIDLGMSALIASGLRDPSRPHLQQLRESTGYSVGLGVLDEAHVVYIDHLRGVRQGQAMDGPKVRLGVRVPAYCTSIGKLLLAFLPNEERESILAQNDRPQRTEHTITQEELLEVQLEEIVERGYAVSDEEFHPGVRSLAVPVRNATEVVAAVNLSVYQSALSMQQLVGDFFPLVGATAEKISRALGYVPSETADHE
jgi:IclR family pca regulon transcriptional regulator